MSDSVGIDIISEKIPLPPLDMDSFINMLWDQDMDMGVDRQFYDPVLRDQELKKQEAEQNRLLELRKKQAQQEMLYFTIDEETGERIPKPSAGPYQPLPEFTEDLSKELAELGEIADLNYLLGDDQKDEANQMGVEHYNNTPKQPARTHHDYNMIIHGQMSPASDIDLWPTEITMIPGPSNDNMPTGMSSLDDPDLYLSQMWGVEDNASSRTSNFYGGAPAYADNQKLTTPYQHYQDEVTSEPPGSRFMSAAASNAPTYYSGTSTDSAFSSSLSSPFGTESSTCSYSPQSYDNKDVKPLLRTMFNPDHTKHSPVAMSQRSAGPSSNSAPTSVFSESENDEEHRMAKTELESERSKACRDEARCRELGIPFSVEQITNHPVEEFNSLLRQHRLTDDQLTLVKDIRRRGKNKVAAQNCRKKKMNELTSLEEEIIDLKKARTDLKIEKDSLKITKMELRQRLDDTYAEVFNSIRDHLGRPYDPRFYTLHLTDDGDARVIPSKIPAYSLLNYHQAA